MNITIKALIGFLLISLVLSVASVLMYFSIGSVAESVSVIGEPSQKIQLWKSVVRMTDEAELCARKWKISKDSSGIARFDLFRDSANAQVNQLHRLCSKDAHALILCDSLQRLSGTRFDLLANWMMTPDSTNRPVEAINEILQPVLSGKLDNLIWNPKTADSLPADKRTFWEKILGKKNKLAQNNVTGMQDSVFHKKIHALKKKIQQAKTDEEVNFENMLLSEMSFLQFDDNITKRISANTDLFEQMSLQNTGEQIRKATNAVAAGTRTITMWTWITVIFLMLVFLFFIQRDVVRNRRLQVQLQAARENAERLAKAKEEFLANMSHEIRSPLNIITGFADQLLKSPLNEAQRMKAESIHRSSDHLVALINDILDFAKMQSGKMELEQIGFRTEDLVTDIRAAFAALAAEKKIGFHIDVNKNFPPIPIGDPVRIRQILFNLISNAIKFTEKGKVVVTFSLLTKNGSDFFEIQVSDTGIGISQDQLQNIFDAFAQADSSITRRYGGTGLGLAITKHITEQMNGTVAVSSEPGSGTTFTVTLPIREGDENDLPVSNHAESAKQLVEGKIILVCDDEPYNRIVAAHLLEAWGATVLEAGSGEEALSMLRRQPADLILMDLQMPNMSGSEAAMAIRSSGNHSISSARIIAVTGRSSAGEKEKLLAGTMDGYLPKPYKEEQLLHEIRRVLNKPFNN